MPATRKAKPESQRRAIRRQYNAATEETNFRSFFAQRGLEIPQPIAVQSRTDSVSSTLPILSTATAGPSCHDPGSFSPDSEVSKAPESVEAMDEAEAQATVYQSQLVAEQCDDTTDNDIQPPLPQPYVDHINLDDFMPRGEDITSGLDSSIPDIETIGKFIQSLKDAKLDDSKMSPEDIVRLREAPSVTADVYTKLYKAKQRAFKLESD
ncbi:hypothetical protein JOM56_000671 [Amanita muscaria]